MEVLGAIFFFCLFSTSNSQNGQCQNGGTYDGIKCICTENFFGPDCEFPIHPAKTTIPVIKPSPEAQTSVPAKTPSPEAQTSVPVNTPSPEDFCMQAVPDGYKQFYFPYFNHTSNTLMCVTHCTQGVPGAIDCNHGECRVLTTGPQCYCSEPNMYWYSGERCNSRVNKLILGGLLALVLLVMLAIIITLSVLLHKATRRRF